MNQLLLAIGIGIITGICSGYYWSTRGYRGWRLYFTGFIAGFGISALVIKSVS